MKFAIITLFLLGCGPCLSQEVDESFPRVVTPLGPIEGYYKNSSNGRLYKAYEGVPYAQPPIGESRFKVPKKILPWTDVLMAKQFASTCLQYEPFPGQVPPGFVSGSEDCLYMNIYTAITDDDVTSHPEGNGVSENLLPVIVFIHGGAFLFGSGNVYGPKYLLNEDVTLVTINYRLGPLGFLSTEDDIVPGNMGLKDQAMALRWIKDNIKFFGGDPSRIMIVGQSAHGAMSLSGTAIDCWAQVEGSLEKAKKLAAFLKCPSDDIQLMVDCLRTVPADEITRALGEFMPFLYNPFTPFGPVVEKGNGKFPFIDQPPIEIMTSGKIPQDLPWITSTVSHEGFYTTAELVTNKSRLDEVNENWETIAPYLLDFNYTIPKKDQSAVAKLIRQNYLGSSPIDVSTADTIVQMVGDRFFAYDGERAASLQARVNRSPVRFYYFSYRGAHSLSENFTTENFGVCHGDDLAYVLDSFFDPTTTAKDREMQQVMIKLWVSFATNGTSDVGVEWSRLSKSNKNKLRYLHIAGPEEIGMESSSNFGNKNFWRSLGLRENIL